MLNPKGHGLLGEVGGGVICGPTPPNISEFSKAVFKAFPINFGHEKQIIFLIFCLIFFKNMFFSRLSYSRLMVMQTQSWTNIIEPYFNICVLKSPFEVIHGHKIIMKSSKKFRMIIFCYQTLIHSTKKKLFNSDDSSCRFSL